MRHAIVVVGSEEQRHRSPPRLVKQEEAVQTITWYVCPNQKNPTRLLDDSGNAFTRMLLVPLLAYRFYVMVHNTKLWSGIRPLILVQGRSLASRVAAYAGTWGGGDVVMPERSDGAPLGPTRFLLDEDGNLKLRSD